MEEAAFATIETELGGRARLVSTLSAAQLPKEMALVVGAIADPQNDQLSLARVCALYDVPLAKLLKIFKEAVLARGQVLALTRVAEALPDVAAAVMDDAKPGERVCPTCEGLCVLPKPTAENPAATQPCDTCRGRGTVFHRPDHDVQRTALQIGGLLHKGAGVQIANIVNPGGSATEAAAGYDQLVRALDDAIYGKGRDRLRASRAQQTDEDGAAAIDGEIADEGEEGRA